MTLWRTARHFDDSSPTKPCHRQRCRSCHDFLGDQNRFFERSTEILIFYLVKILLSSILLVTSAIEITHPAPLAIGSFIGLMYLRKSVILWFRYEPSPGVGGCPQILMYLSYFGWFLKYLRENWPPIGGQKILSISVKFLEANSFRNSNPFQKFRLRRHSKPEYFLCT